jgi:hypothetical protein
MIRIEGSPTLEEENVPAPLRARYEESLMLWRNVAREEARAIESIGHLSLVVVIDGVAEYAIGCDHCGLWMNRSRQHPQFKDSVEHHSGALLEALQCDPREIHRRYGHLVTRVDPFTGMTSWNFDQWIFDPSDPVMRRSSEGTGGWRGKWRDKNAATKKPRG